MALLEVRGFTRRFGGLVAVDSLDFDVEEGELFGIIGPNGAGKTTLFGMISGALRPTRGRIVFKGQNITGLSAHRVAAKGIVRTFQVKNLFYDMSVLENMLTAYHLHYKCGNWSHLLGTPSARADQRAASQTALEILYYVGLGDKQHAIAKSLPYGHQSALGIALAMAADPKVLLLDEPVTGMTEEELHMVIDLIHRIRERGVTIIIVEHNMRVIMGLCERIMVLNFGRKIAEGRPDEIRRNKEVIQAYLGAEEDE